MALRLSTLLKWIDRQNGQLVEKSPTSKRITMQPLSVFSSQASTFA